MRRFMGAVIRGKWDQKVPLPLSFTFYLRKQTV